VSARFGLLSVDLSFHFKEDRIERVSVMKFQCWSISLSN